MRQYVLREIHGVRFALNHIQTLSNIDHELGHLAHTNEVCTDALTGRAQSLGLPLLRCHLVGRIGSGGYQPSRYFGFFPHFAYSLNYPDGTVHPSALLRLLRSVIQSGRVFSNFYLEVQRTVLLGSFKKHRAKH